MNRGGDQGGVVREDLLEEVIPRGRAGRGLSRWRIRAAVKA